MYIVSTNESLFDKEDIYESLIAHCGLEYASSVFRILGVPLTNKDFDKKQRQIEALEQELDSYTMDLGGLTSGIQEAIDQLDDVLGKKRISHEAIKNIRDKLVRMTNKKK